MDCIPPPPPSIPLALDPPPGCFIERAVIPAWGGHCVICADSIQRGLVALQWTHYRGGSMVQLAGCWAHGAWHRRISPCSTPPPPIQRQAPSNHRGHSGRRDTTGWPRQITHLHICTCSRKLQVKKSDNLGERISVYRLRKDSSPNNQ